MLESQFKSEFINYCHQQYPQEACGVITGDRRLLKCKNIASEPENNFEIDPADLINAENAGGIKCILHSHTKNQKSFSSTDTRQIKAHGVPWFLYVLPLGTEDYFDPNEELPLLGRPWRYGLTDCYSLVQDWFKREKQIGLADFPRGEVGEWEQPGWNAFLENITSQGFKQISTNVPLQVGDFILMQIYSPNPNHCGVIVDSEKNHLLHHLIDRLSEISVYGGYWSKVMTGIYRHHQLI